MGGGRWSPDEWSTYKTTVASKPVDHIYTSKKMVNELDPLGVKIRESRDSAANPESTAVIVALDVTGSMDMVLDSMAKKGLGTVIEELISRKPVTDPAIMIMAIGDAACDRSPLQVTQFESETVLIKQLEKLYLERGGGGNNTESYDLPWYFAAQHTSIDCFEKRNKKGYLFTVGDEQSPNGLSAAQIKRFIGDDIHQKLGARELLTMVERTYNVFHIVVEQGNYALGHKDAVFSSWRELLGQRVLPLSDHTKLAEVIVSTIQMMEGESKTSVVSSWKGDTSLVVKRAIDGLTKSPGDGGTTGVVRLS